MSSGMASACVLLWTWVPTYGSEQPSEGIPASDAPP